MSDIEQLTIYSYQLESIQDILDRVSLIGRQAGIDAVRDTRPDDPEYIAWAFLAISHAADRLRSATEAAASRAAAVVEEEDTLLKEARAQRDDAELRAGKFEALYEIQKKHTGRAKTFATLWKRAAKANRALYLTTLTTKQVWKEYALGEGDKPDVEV